MVPIENSAHGLVFEAMDLLLQNDLRIIGEYYLPVQHFLLGHKQDDVNLEGKVVHSHPQAIGQCRKYITKKGLRVEFEDDTAGAAHYVAELTGDQIYNHLAIASERASKEYDLAIIAQNIQDRKTNTTRFLVVRPGGRKSTIEDRVMAEGMYKATVRYDVLPWDLWKPLSLVANAGYKTNVLHTRPSDETEGSDRVFNRVHYSDVGIPSRMMKSFNELLAAIGREIGKSEVKLLGIYPAGKIQLERYAR